MTRWEPDIDTKRQPAAERNDPEMARAIERIRAGRRAVEERTQGKHWNDISDHDKHILQLNEQRRREQRNEQRKQDRRPQGRTGERSGNHRQQERTRERSGNRRELGKTRYKGRDWDDRTNACLREVGVYRSATHSDLANTHFDGNNFAATRGIQAWVRSGAMRAHQLEGAKGGKFTVYTLTPAGAALAQRLAVKNGLDQQQKAWSGLVKSKEASHDAAVTSACRKEITQLAEQGATLHRVRIDAELKSILAKRSETARAEEGKEAADRARHEAAQQLHLPIDAQGHVQIPDAQLEFTNTAGDLAHVNVEVTTDNYREGCTTAKAGAGFSMHGGGAKSSPGAGLSSLGGSSSRRGGGSSSRDSSLIEI